MNDFNWLNAYPQICEHSNAAIVGTSEALAKLRDSLNILLSHDDCCEEVELFASDGEGYTLRLRKTESIAGYRPPYA
jgi:hypothetical protein